MYLLDTNIISELRKINTGRIDKNVLNWVSSIDLDKTYLNSIVVGELYQGVLAKRHKKDFIQADILFEWLQSLLDMYQDRILIIDNKTTMIWAELQTPNPKSVNDAYIASTAIVHNLNIATRNIKDFNGMPVKLINPFECLA